MAFLLLHNYTDFILFLHIPNNRNSIFLFIVGFEYYPIYDIGQIDGFLKYIYNIPYDLNLTFIVCS